MMYYSRPKLAAVLAVCLLGLLLCLPNFVRMPGASLPWRQIHLGLDLRGGSYLLLRVDLPTLQRERLDSLTDQVRQALLRNGLGYRDLKPDQAQAAVSFQPRTPDEAARDLSVLGAMQGTVPDEFAARTLAGGRIGLVLSPAALRTRARDAVAQSIEIVRRRIDATGAVDPTITPQGDDRIVVELPGVSDPDRIRQLLGTTAKMTFRLVADGVSPQGTMPPGVDLLPMQENPQQKLPVFHHVDVDGADLTNATASQDQQTGGYAIAFTLDSVGAQQFAAITRANLGKQFAVVLDNKVITAPVIQGVIPSGTGQITGRYTAQAATDLALLLRAGALPAPLAVIEQRSVGPTLGADSVRAGAISLVVGFVLVVLFMGVFYGLFGWFANLALLCNLVLMLAILSLFGATLTLPGMAGLLLTLGMAVDANILINERIREEVKRGRTALAAMQAGFERATSTIVDSNATAFLAHVMLFVFGSGAVKGFALTITIGIATTLFTTLLLSRMLLVRWYALRRPALLPV